MVWYKSWRYWVIYVLAVFAVLVADHLLYPDRLGRAALVIGGGLAVYGAWALWQRNRG